MKTQNWKITAYAWIVGITIWTGTCYGMLLVG